MDQTDERWKTCEGTWDRLRWARLKAGFEQAKDAAESLNMKDDTYRAYERRPGSSKHTELDHQRAQQFARKYKVSWLWLLLGEGSPTDAADPGDPIMRIARAMEGHSRQQQESVVELVERLLKVG